jgi:hypothetical protein
VRLLFNGSITAASNRANVVDTVSGRHLGLWMLSDIPA